MSWKCASRSLASFGLVLVVAVGALAENVDTDSRFQRPLPPTSLDDLTSRFLPDHVPLSPRGSVVLEQGETYAFTQRVTAGVCYAVAGIGGDGISDLDLHLSRDGRVVAQDAQLDDYPLVHYCPASDGDLRVSLRAFTGSGSGEFQILVDPNSYYAARGSLDELSNRLDSASARTAPRWTPLGAQWRNQFPRPGLRELHFEAEPGWCYAVVAVGQASVADIDLRMRRDAEEIDVDREGGDVAGVATCTDEAGPIVVDVAVVRGTGVVAAQVLAHEAL